MNESRTLFAVAVTAGLIWWLSPDKPQPVPDNTPPPTPPTVSRPLPTLPPSSGLSGMSEAQQEIKLDFTGTDMAHINQRFIALGGHILLFDAVEQNYKTIDVQGKITSADNLDIRRDESVPREMTEYFLNLPDLPHGVSQAIYLWPKELWQQIQAQSQASGETGLLVYRVNAWPSTDALHLSLWSVNGRRIISDSTFYLGS